MITPAIKRCIARGQRGNPKWGKASAFEPAKPTYFDLELAKLGLTETPEAWPWSSPLRKFAEKHRRAHYIPESLLRIWGLELEEGELHLVA